MKKKIFTIVELLIVIAVIALLAGLAFPVLNKAMAQSRKTSCVNNLRQIGISINGYVNDYRGFLPSAIRIGDGPSDPLSIPNIVKIDKKEIFQCPADTKKVYEEMTYYGRYGTSYEWNIWYNNRPIESVKLSVLGNTVKTPLMLDAENFHGSLGKNYLYHDGRVSRSLEDTVE